MNRVSINGVEYVGNNVIITSQGVVIDGVPQDGEKLSGIVEVRVLEGRIENLTSSASVTCQNVEGNVDAGGSVTCENVAGDVDAGGSVNCGSVGGKVDAGGSVKCHAVGGKINAGGSVRHG